VNLDNLEVQYQDFDLEERLINFSVRVLRLVDSLPDSRTANHIRGQLLRCGTAASPNYAEARDAESRADFIHKLKIVLKELSGNKSMAKFDSQNRNRFT
jgi:four helix bundle protein